MNTKYLSKNPLEKYLNKEDQEIDDKTIFITSISDLIEVIETNNKRPSSELNCADICRNLEPYTNSGKIHIAELDQEKLYNNLFEDEIWQKFSNAKENPLQIVRYLSLRKFDESVWWTESIFDEMKSQYE
jgi:hypothetical protein